MLTIFVCCSPICLSVCDFVIEYSVFCVSVLIDLGFARKKKIQFVILGLDWLGFEQTKLLTFGGLGF